MDAPVGISVQFRPITLTSHEIVDLQVGDVVPLRHLATTPLTVAVEGVPCQFAVPGRRGRRLACLIVDPQQVEENPSWPS